MGGELDIGCITGGGQGDLAGMVGVSNNVGLHRTDEVSAAVIGIG